MSYDLIGKCVFILALLAVFSSMGFAANWVVNSTGPRCTNGIPYGTIQAALNVASDGDTIYVCEGNYNENVVVNKSINIFGWNSASSVTVSGTTFNVYSNYVNISNLTIHGSDTPAVYANATGVSFSNLIVNANRDVGIEINSNFVSLSDSTLNSALDDAIQFHSTASNNLIDNVTITGTGDASSDGIVFISQNAHNNSLVSVTINGKNNLAGHAIGFALNSNNNTLANGVVHNITYGISLGSGTFASNNIITRTSIYNATYGIYLHSSAANNLIFLNLIYNNTYGVYSDGTNAINNIYNNPSISNNTYGIYLLNTNYTNVTNNTLFANTYGISGVGPGSATLCGVNVSNNFISSTLSGISFDFEGGTNVIGNRITNTPTSISFTYGSSNYVATNSISNSSAAAISVGTSVSNSNFYNNVLANGSVGIVLSGLFISNNRIYSNTIYNNTNDMGVGILFDGVDKLNHVYGNSIIDNNSIGIYLHNTHYTNVTGNTASYNMGAFFADGGSSNNFTANTGINGTEVFLCSGSNNRFVNNNATNGELADFIFTNGTNNLIQGNTASFSSIGFALTDVGGAVGNNTLTGNIAHDNSVAGFNLTSTDNNVVTSNLAYNNGYVGIFLNESSNNSVSSNRVSNHLFNIGLIHSPNNTLISNNISVSGLGVVVATSNDVVLSSNLVYSSSKGIYVLDSGHVTSTNNIIYNHSDTGFDISGSNTTLTGDQFYGNLKDFAVSSGGSPSTNLALSSVIFANNASLTNYTNLSLSDIVTNSYAITYATIPAALDMGYTSVNNKYLTITDMSGPTSIDNIIWNWFGSDEVGLIPSRFGISKYSGGSWVKLSPVLDLSTRTLNLTGLSSFGVFALLETPVTQSGGGGSPPSNVLSLAVVPSCDGNLVTVKTGSTLVTSATIQVDGTVVGATDNNGQFSFSGCGNTAIVRASKSGDVAAVLEVPLVVCNTCGPTTTGCINDSGCSASEVCAEGKCIAIQCQSGKISNHVCVVPGCTANSDCSATEQCIAGKCVAITGCGIIQNHTLAPYECGTEIGCKSCLVGFNCVEHKCLSIDMTCTTTGDKTICVAVDNGKPCTSCTYEVVDPSDKKISGQFDAKGTFQLPVNLTGTYEVSVLKDGLKVKTLFVPIVSSILSPNPVQQGKGSDLVLILGLLVLLIAIVGGLLYMKSPSKNTYGKKK